MKAIRKRSLWVEPLFAEAKDWHGLRRFRLRRLWRVNSEALLTAPGQHLKRLLSWRGWGRRPWPSGAPGLRVRPSWAHTAPVWRVLPAVWCAVVLVCRSAAGAPARPARLATTAA
jgi:hypothetical protein